MCDVVNARECKGQKGWPHHARCMEKISFGKGSGQSFGKVSCLSRNDGMADLIHRHLQRPRKSRVMPKAYDDGKAASNTFYLSGGTQEISKHAELRSLCRCRLSQRSPERGDFTLLSR